MPSTSKHTITLIAVAIVLVVLVLTASIVLNEAQGSRGELEPLGTVPQFELTERSGVDFGSDDLKGKISVVDFIFTGCQGPCPIMADNMSILYKAFAGSNRVQFISISVDPANDRLSVLQDYARRQGVTDSRWVFLHGEFDTVRWLSESGFKLAADQLPAMHSTKFVLVDDKGQIRGYYSGTELVSVNVLKTHIRELVQAMK